MFGLKNNCNYNLGADQRYSENSFKNKNYYNGMWQNREAELEGVEGEIAVQGKRSSRGSIPSSSLESEPIFCREFGDGSAAGAL
jgi:hypothetical protein